MGWLWPQSVAAQPLSLEKASSSLSRVGVGGVRGLQETVGFLYPGNAHIPSHALLPSKLNLQPQGRGQRDPAWPGPR